MLFVCSAGPAGAPSNVDELYTLWAGGRIPNCGTLSGWARMLGNEMNTVFVGKSILNEAVVNLLTEMLYAARSGEWVFVVYTMRSCWMSFMMFLGHFLHTWRAGQYLIRRTQPREDYRVW